MLASRLQKRLASDEQRLCDIEKEMTQSLSAEDWQELSLEYGRLLTPVETYRQWCAAQQKIADMKEMHNDPELAEMAQEECDTAAAECHALEEKLRRWFAPAAAEDERNCFLEIRAAVGGNESCLFASALFRMYCRYAEARGWKMDVISQAAGEVGGSKEIISRIVGNGAFGRLRRESGAHRVQRVPETESQGRIHTSVVTVAVMAEALPEDNINIVADDLRVETFRSSGAGGQHVNTTDSAVRITHLPTGTVVECQDDRSQHKNRERAMSVLRARIAAQKQRERQQKEASQRKILVGSGDRSDRIRTYNFPQGRMTDHRIGLTLRKLTAIMEGDLDDILDALAADEGADD